MKTNGTNARKDDTLGAIGIGAMIVFIALILVAAVAAAVIIQTAEKLQQNAQATGDDTAEQMSGKVMLNAVYIGAGGNNLELYGRLSPGSDGVAAVADIGFQIFCSGGNSDEGAVAAVLDMGTRNGAATPLEAGQAYIFRITLNNCAVPTTAEDHTLFLHVANGGTTLEILQYDGTTTEGTPIV